LVVDEMATEKKSFGGRVLKGAAVAGAGFLGVLGVREGLAWLASRGAGSQGETAPTPTPATPSKPKPSGTTTTGGPPNTSGDPAGYNTTLFDSVAKVRYAFLDGAGYDAAQGKLPSMEKTAAGRAIVSRFQSDWNRVVAARSAGTWTAPVVKNPGHAEDLRGRLSVDGVPGKNTLNALEIVWTNKAQNGLDWQAAAAETKG
jgi:hypothetical protein